MKVSVIIPCYNIEQHLPKCIESIMMQSFDNFELLLINDGSIDHTGDICDRYAKKDPRIRVFHQENAGVSAARNYGLEVSTGQVLMFIDGDDYIKYNYIERLINNYHKDTWHVCGMINVKNEEAKENPNYQKLISKYRDKPINIYNIIDLLKYSSLSSPCGRIYSQTIIKSKQLRFDEKLTYQEDLIFNLEYIQYIKNIKLLDYFGYFYINHTFSSTSRFHQNFNHVNFLYLELRKYINEKEHEVYLKRFIFDTIIKRITNLFHANSNFNELERIKILGDIFNSVSFVFSKDHLIKSNLNKIFKWLIYRENQYLLYIYLNLRFIIDENHSFRSICSSIQGRLYWLARAFKKTSRKTWI